MESFSSCYDAAGLPAQGCHSVSCNYSGAWRTTDLATLGLSKRIGLASINKTSISAESTILAIVPGAWHIPQYWWGWLNYDLASVNTNSSPLGFSDLYPPTQVCIDHCCAKESSIRCQSPELTNVIRYNITIFMKDLGHIPGWAFSACCPCEWMQFITCWHPMPLRITTFDILNALDVFGHLFGIALYLIFGLYTYMLGLSL